MAKMHKDDHNNDIRLELLRFFASSIAHDLKTPLSAAHMNIQLLQNIISSAKITKGDKYTIELEPEEYEMLFNEVPNTISNTLNKGLKQIDMLVFSLKDEILTQDLGKYPIKQVIEEALLDYHLTSKEAERIKVISVDNFNVYCPKVFLKHVIMQLLKNAFKHSGSNSFITITNQDRNIIFSDNGSGISPEVIPHIFDRFYTSNADSTGLGLSFCKMVMEALNGSISCFSTLGKGTTFTLSFPPINQ